MKLPKFAAISFLVFSSFAATGVAPTKSELEGMYDKAFREFDANHYSAALKALDAIDARQPDLAESLNLRGVILMRQGQYDRAEAALRKALQVEPKFWNASFNLAEIPFLRKDWPEARNRFEALVAGNTDGLQNETSLLIQYKILLTFVLQGNEKMASWIIDKFEQSKESPALYFSNAAIALQHNNQKEAKDWMDAAAKQYSPHLNKLFAESFYEIGWMQKPPGEARAALEITSTAERAERLQADARANYEKAERAFQQRDFDGALKLLDLSDEGVPNQPASFNLRGEILMEQKKFDEAEAVFQKAVAADPKFREAQYNLAQIPFKKKQYAKARQRFEALFAQTPGDEKNQAAQLLKFKIFMTLLLEGQEAPAQKMMDQFKFTGDTPALYYAQAAWAFKHANPDQGNDWIVSARKIYSQPLNIVFADSFYDLGWLTRPAEAAPPTAALAQAAAAPPAATPAMRFGAAESPSPAGSPAASASPVVAQAVPAATVAAPNETKTTPAPATAASAPPVAVAAAPKQSPPIAAATAAPKAAAPPIVTKRAAKPVAPPIVAAKASVAPSATISAPARPSVSTPAGAGEEAERSSIARMLLVWILLLAGSLLLIWLIVQQVRRRIPRMDLYGSSVPLTEPPLTRETMLSGDETKVSRDLLAAGPPKVSLQLRATEALRAGGVQPPITAGPAAAPPPEKEKPLPPLPNEKVKPAVAPAPMPAPVPVPVMSSLAAAKPEAKPGPVEQTKPAPVPETSPRRDLEEVSRAAAPVKETPAPVQQPPRHESAPAIAADWEIVTPQKESVRQAQYMPRIVIKPTAETPMTEVATPEITRAEITTPEPPPIPVRPAPESAVAAALAGRAAEQSSVETPSFASKIITTKPTTPHSTTPVTMPETTITPAPVTRTPSPTMAVQQPSGGMHTAVQLTFSLEIASMQLTPTFKMSGLLLKPTSKVVTMRLAPSQHPQPPMNLQVTFEVARIDMTGGAITTVRLAPSGQEKPAVLSSTSFAVSGLELMAAGGAAPVQITPSHQEQASVHLTAAFQIAAIEFSPLFEITAIVLNSTSKNVSLQLPGAGPSSIDGAPIFEMENVQLAGTNEIGMIQVVPVTAGGRRA